MAKSRKKNTQPTASLGFEAKLWEAADLLRNNMDPSEYKHVVLKSYTNLIIKDEKHD